jgi:hypothetical protein
VVIVRGGFNEEKRRAQKTVSDRKEGEAKIFGKELEE